MEIFTKNSAKCTIFQKNDCNNFSSLMADCYGLDSNDLPDDAFPISYTLLDRKQKKDKTLLKRAQTTTRAYSLKKFHGGGTTVRFTMFQR
jgi:hypothetical protein